VQNLQRLVDIMARLRGPDGCPWDLKQTHRSLKPYLIEEGYEVLEAVDAGDDRELCEELGDLLLQIAFHAQIASEEGRFDLDQIAGAIAEKLIRRHPHIFGDITVESAEEVLTNWEAIKSAEKEEKGADTSVLSGVPRHLPALLRARRIQDRAAKVGFEWAHAGEAAEKAREEVTEFLEARKEGDSERVAEELGDLLFALVNVARYSKICPEEALTGTIQKFLTRFRYIEDELRRLGTDAQDATIEQMDQLWEAAKRAEVRPGD